MMLYDSQSLKSVPKPGGSGDLLSSKFDILPPRNYNTDNKVDCETQNMAFSQQDETLPIIREENTTDHQIRKKTNLIWKELHQIRSGLDHSNNNLVTAMLNRERREIENLCCLLRSKDREIVELCSDLLVKEKLIVQLQINKVKLMSQMEDCNKEPWKQPKKPVKQSFPPTWAAVPTGNIFNPLQSLQSEQETIEDNDDEITPLYNSQIPEIRRQRKVQLNSVS